MSELNEMGSQAWQIGYEDGLKKNLCRAAKINSSADSKQKKEYILGYGYGLCDRCGLNIGG